jgi:DNA-binding beta-propeller fold protein YncE
MDLNDTNGNWFDTGLQLFGGKSLAVAEMPTIGINQTGTAVASGGGILSGQTIPSVSGQIAGLLNQLGLGGVLSPTTAQLEASLTGLFQNPDLPTPAVEQLFADLGATTNEQAVHNLAAIIDQEITALRTAQPNTPINLDTLPVGVDFGDTLGDLAAVLAPGVTLPVTAKFHNGPPKTQTAHKVTSLIWPTGAQGMPFDQSAAFIGDVETPLTKPGLYAFTCQIHPYMLGAIVVDDPTTVGLDFGKQLSVSSRGNMSVPSNSDIIYRLVQAFFKITVPNNWQKFSDLTPGTWDPQYPIAPILVWDAAGKPILLPSLDGFFQSYFHEPKPLPALNQRPATPGVGEVWIDTEMETTSGKTKPGTATKVNVENWTVERKVAQPGINMNNPHNMWTDKDQKLIYQTEWFSNRLTVFNRETGALVRTIEVGPAPSHVMTRTDTDQLHVALNSGNAVAELEPGGTVVDRRIPVQLPGEKVAHPHAHWMSADGHTMVTPNVNLNNSTVVDVPTGNIYHEQTGKLPIASSMMPDSSKYYQADFLDGTVSCISLGAPACVADDGSLVHYKAIDLWQYYNPVTGPTGGGPFSFGGLPIQLPVTPDGQAMVVMNTLTSNMLVIDPEIDKVVKELPCDAGCHGMNFGAKRGGGYYGYASSKFANSMAVVDPDPNGDGNPIDAAIVGKQTLDAGLLTARDDNISGYSGMGGMGVMAIPNAYNGWVQQVPNTGVFARLTCRQRHPITYLESC